MTYKELKAFALEHYNEGGDGVYECWDERTFNEYVAEFGEITEEKAMAMLEVKNITISYQNRPTVTDFSMTLEKGQICSLVGESGSGKTTLLRCLNNLEEADEGEVWIDGQKRELGDGATFGLVFQSFNLFPQYTVLENITLAPTLLKKGTPEELKAQGEALLQQVGLSDKLENYPYQLSGGQQQRVAIARALALQPEVLCFDEPTSALDPELTGEVLRVIRGLKNKNNTMIVVTHEMEFAKSVADVVIYMSDGVIEEIGTPEQVFDHPASEKTRSFLRGTQNF